MLTLEAPGRQDPPQDQLLGPGPASSPESEPERAGFTMPPTHTDRQTDSAEPTRTPPTAPGPSDCLGTTGRGVGGRFPATLMNAAAALWLSSSRAASTPTPAARPSAADQTDNHC